MVEKYNGVDIREEFIFLTVLGGLIMLVGIGLVTGLAYWFAYSPSGCTPDYCWDSEAERQEIESRLAAEFKKGTGYDLR